MIKSFLELNTKHKWLNKDHVAQASQAIIKIPKGIDIPRSNTLQPSR
jgi:hypothetical protein